MLKKINIIFILISIVFSLVFTSCNLDVNNETGELTINFRHESSKSTLQPEIVMEVESYLITGIGPEGRTFPSVISNGESVTIKDLFYGDWEITVQGLNENNIPIGIGSANVKIIPEKEISTSIIVSEYTEDGTLDLELNWPHNDINDPQITALLTHPATGFSKTLDFIIDKDMGIATYNGNIPSGYYILTLGLYDGITTQVNNKLMGKTYSVRIVTNNTTSNKLVLTGDNLNLYGDVNISIENNIMSPFSVSISNDTTLFEGETTMFTATTSCLDGVTFAWYLDGVIQDETSNEFVNESNLSLGKHNVDIVAMKNGTFTSDSTIVTIKELPISYVQLKLTDPNTGLLKHKLSYKYGITNFAEIMQSYKEIQPEVGLLSINNYHNIYNTGVNTTLINALMNNTPINDDISSLADNSYVNIFMPSSIGEYQITDDNYEVGIQIYDFTMYPEYSPIAIDSISCDSFQLNITEYGNVNELVKGSIFLENAEVNKFEDDTQTYTKVDTVNIEINFQILRGIDYGYNTITFNDNINTEYTNDIVSANIPIILNEYYDKEEINLNRDGFVFTEWNTEEDGSGISYSDVNFETIPPSDTNIILYAIWEIEE